MAKSSAAALIRKALKGEPSAKVETMRNGGTRIMWEDGLSGMTVMRLAENAAPETHFQLERTESRRLKEHAVAVVNAYFETTAYLDETGNIVTGNAMATKELSLYRAIVTAMNYLDGEFFQLDPENEGTPLWLQIAVANAQERAVERSMQGVDLIVREEPLSRIVHPEVAEQEAWHEYADRLYAAHHWVSDVETAEIIAWGEYIYRETKHIIAPDNFDNWLREIGASETSAYAPTVDSPTQVRNYVCARMGALSEGYEERQASHSLRAMGRPAPRGATRSQILELYHQAQALGNELADYFATHYFQARPVVEGVSIESDHVLSPMERCITIPVTRGESEITSYNRALNNDPLRNIIRALDLTAMEPSDMYNTLRDMMTHVKEEDARG